MTEVFYKKQGRKYVPVSYYDSNVMEGFPPGTHLVSVGPNCSSRRYRIDAALAPMIAAGLIAEDAIVKAIADAAQIRPSTTPITEEQKAAWDALSKAFGEDSHRLTWPAYIDVARAGVIAMQIEAAKLLENPAVKAAYEEFLVVSQLSKF